MRALKFIPLLLSFFLAELLFPHEAAYSSFQNTLVTRLVGSSFNALLVKCDDMIIACNDDLFVTNLKLDLHQI